MDKPKYKLVPCRAKDYPDSLTGIYSDPMYRIKAVAGVPERGIKRGKLGGLVSGPEVLSQNGTCWIDYNAVAVLSSITVNALIADDALVLGAKVSGNAIVRESAKVGLHSIVYDSAQVTGQAETSGTQKDPTLIADASVVTHNAVVHSSYIAGDSRIMNRSNVQKCRLNGHSVISGDAKIQESTIVNSTIADGATVTQSIVSGDSKISGWGQVKNSSLSRSSSSDEAQIIDCKLENTRVQDRAVLKGSTFTGSFISGITQLEDATYSGVTLGKEEWKEYLAESAARIRGGGVQLTLEMGKPVSKALGSVVSKSVHLITLEAIEKSYEEYSSDIVKLLKYPVMTDMADEHTRTLVKNLRKCRRYADAGEESELAKALDDLEDSFLMAESNARKIEDSHLTDEQKKKLQNARQMFELALNDGATDHEKAASFKAGMGNLKGIIDISENAVLALKTRIGLKELST